MIEDIYYAIKFKLLDLKDSVSGIYYNALYSIEDIRDSIKSKLKPSKKKKSKGRLKKVK